MAEIYLSVSHTYYHMFLPLGFSLAFEKLQNKKKEIQENKRKTRLQRF